MSGVGLQTANSGDVIDNDDGTKAKVMRMMSSVSDLSFYVSLVMFIDTPWRCKDSHQWLVAFVGTLRTTLPWIFSFNTDTVTLQLAARSFSLSATSTCHLYANSYQ